MALDRMGNPYLADLYADLTHGEKLIHFNHVGTRIAHHKRAYYTGHPEINDCEYDYIERYYEAVAADLGLEPTAINSVGYKDP